MSGNIAEPIQKFVNSDFSLGELKALETLLTEAGTFNFPALENGLFPAAGGSEVNFDETGYSNCWVRDNVLVSYALFDSEPEVATKCIATLADFFRKHSHRFTDIIHAGKRPGDEMLRPHIRFNGELLQENTQTWAHAQNDALGYFLWLYCKMIQKGDLQPTENCIDLLKLFVDYFHTIRFWEDEDSGHWEETAKIEASSIGAATAGLIELRRLLEVKPALIDPASFSVDQRERLDNAICQGQGAMKQILPAECNQPDPKKKRQYDAALLFLIEPLEMVEKDMADQIIENVKTHLLGDYGIRRYPGDSYWCDDYKVKLKDRTCAFNKNQDERDKLLTPGKEAQWCIFDPVLSVIYAKRYHTSGLASDRAEQLYHFRRALTQLTTSSCAAGELRCPESYYVVKGEYVPNDITPLLWTQANLLQALQWMKKTT